MPGCGWVWSGWEVTGLGVEGLSGLCLGQGYVGPEVPVCSCWPSCFLSANTSSPAAVGLRVLLNGASHTNYEAPPGSPGLLPSAACASTSCSTPIGPP